MSHSAGSEVHREGTHMWERERGENHRAPQFPHGYCNLSCRRAPPLQQAIGLTQGAAWSLCNGIASERRHSGVLLVYET